MSTIQKSVGMSLPEECCDSDAAKYYELEKELKLRLQLDDSSNWARNRTIWQEVDSDESSSEECLRFVGGVDISFAKNVSDVACAAYVIVELPSLEVVYESCEMVPLTVPYMPGFLGFREAPLLTNLITKQKLLHPEISPQVILVDGNGILHPRGFGLACHIGVELDSPSIGVAKKLLFVDGLLKDNKVVISKFLHRGGDHQPLMGQSGQQLGVVLRSTDKSPNPVFVSPGHKISMDTAVWVVCQCCKYRIPEPVRLADILSRKYIADNFKSEVTVEEEKNKCNINTEKRTNSAKQTH